MDFSRPHHGETHDQISPLFPLARASANDAPILLMDEAFSALDPLIRSDMQSVLLDLQQDIGKTIVFSGPWLGD